MPKHDFLAIPKDSTNLSQIIFDFYNNDVKSIKTYTIEDSIILYLNPMTFSWIKSSWNGDIEASRLGISYYGFSVIKDKNIILLREIFFNFLQLFKYAPNSLYVEKNTIEISKEAIINAVEGFIEFINHSLENNLSILHCGI